MGDRLKAVSGETDRQTNVCHCEKRERGQIEVTLLFAKSRMTQNLDRVVFIRELEQ